MLDDVPENGRIGLCDMILSQRDVFAYTPGRAKVDRIGVRLNPGSTPSYQYPYRYNLQKLAAIEEDISFLLKNGLAVPHKGAWSSPPVVVPKPNGQWRVCQDYRKVNKMIESDVYPIPRILI